MFSAAVFFMHTHGEWHTHDACRSVCTHSHRLGSGRLTILNQMRHSLHVLLLPGTQAAYSSASDRYIWSVTPCLLAWPAVTMPSGPGSFALASVLGVTYVMDRQFASRGLLPAWYMSLRVPLTLGAVAGLLTTAGSSLLDVQQEEAQRTAK